MLGKASDIVREKLVANGGMARMRMLGGGAIEITITKDGKAFQSDKLPGINYEFAVFDVVVDLLQRQNGSARKGNGRSKSKLGEKGCELDTVAGAVGHYYAGKQPGESVLDPVFALAAILEWAELCDNERGYVHLRSSAQT